MNIYFFGCWNGRLGHYLYDPHGRSYRHDRLLPWPNIDGVLAPDGEAIDPYRRTEAQGVAKLHHRGGWTALAWWD